MNGFDVRELRSSVEGLMSAVEEEPCDALLFGPETRHADATLSALRARGVHAPAISILDGPACDWTWKTACTSFLDCGGDDVLSASVPPEVVRASLCARIRLAKRPLTQVKRFRHGDSTLEIDIGNRRVYIDGRELTLSGYEMEVLLLLTRHGRRSRDDLLDDVYGADAASHGSNTIEVFVARTRRKIGPFGKQFLKTVRGVGYELVGRI
jgi:DNA-binding response OmpR family regulator